jgi:hypothetical protein
LKLVSINISNHHSYCIIEQFEESILEDKLLKSSKKKLSILDNIHIHFLCKLKRWGISFNYSTKKIYKNNLLSDSFHRFCIMMGPNGAKWNKYFPTWHAKSLYMFDAWPALYPKIYSFVLTNKIDNLFVSSSKAAIDLKDHCGLKNVYWVPEGININYYNYLPYDQKDIDLISYGRSFQPYHETIFGKIDINYIFSKPDELLFKTHKELAETLSKSKISICFPSSLTHPERTSGIETMTNRYLEAIASKCLILGKAPLEMIELFGYNPVIEVDFKNPARQLKGIIQNYQNYTGIVEKNYKALLKNHLWEHRWILIKKYMSEANSH